MSLESIGERLVNQCVTVGKEEHVTRLVGLKKDIDERHRGACLAGSRRHHQQGAALACLKGFSHTADRLMLIRSVNDGNDLPLVKGTLWAAYNGVTEYVDSARTTFGDGKWLDSVWFGEGCAIKTRACDLAVAVANEVHTVPS